MTEFAPQSGLFSAQGLSTESPAGFEKITEGSTAVLFPPALGKSRTTHTTKNNNNDDAEDDGQAVFYNPAQVVNRDLSICVIECFARLRREETRRRGGTREGITILEALSATGLRAIRYYKEITGVRYIIANDMDADAVDCIRRNCTFNGVPCVAPTLTENFPSDRVELDESAGLPRCGAAVVPNHDDAVDLMFRLGVNPFVHGNRRLCAVRDGETEPLLQQELMDVVDLDPYGSASPFLDAAMRCIKEGGLLLVTSTDSPILCGNYPDTCHAKYNSLPCKGATCHEMAVRILLAAAERVANKHSKYIVPLLSLHIDFYVRCFFRVYTQPAEVKLSPCKLGHVLQCTRCPAFWVRPMAVRRAPRSRAKKRDRQNNNNNDAMASATAHGNESNHNNSNNNHMHNKHDVVGDLHEIGASSMVLAESAGRESFPAAPSREEIPRLSACGMQSFPNLRNGHGCPVCGNFVTLSGPIYAAPTQHRPFLSQLLQEVEARGAAGRISAEARVAGLVRAAMDELPHTPLFTLIPDVASHMRARLPPTPRFVGALARLGYSCSQVHCAPSGIKTDCPPEVLMGVMLQWKHRQEAQSQHHPQDDEQDESGEGKDQSKAETRDEKEGVLDETEKPGAMMVTPVTEADFSYERQFDFRSSVTGVTKFIPNAPHWGPRRRHQGALHEDEE